MNQDISPVELRHRIRAGEFTTNTSGYSPGFVQGNLLGTDATGTATNSA